MEQSLCRKRDSMLLGHSDTHHFNPFQTIDGSSGMKDRSKFHPTSGRLPTQMLESRIISNLGSDINVGDDMPYQNQMSSGCATQLWQNTWVIKRPI